MEQGTKKSWLWSKPKIINSRGRGNFLGDGPAMDECLTQSCENSADEAGGRGGQPRAGRPHQKLRALATDGVRSGAT